MHVQSIVTGGVVMGGGGVQGREGVEMLCDLVDALYSLAQMSEGDFFGPRGLFGLGGHDAERGANLRLCKQ